MSTKKVMRLLDPHSGMVRCKDCGSVHTANIRPMSNGSYYRGSWQLQAV
jgi:uncharacterized Zn finger protein